MATRTATKRPAKKVAPKKVAPPVEEIEEDELEEDEELDEEELDEEDEEDEAPPKAKKKSTTPSVTFGASDLAKWLTEKYGEEVTSRNLRTLIRKMARDGTGRVDRDIVPGNRTRYDWSGPNDPEVKRIIKAYASGELEADKQEKLAALKARKAEKDAAAGTVVKAGTRKAAAKKAAAKKRAAVVVDEDEEDEELELEDDE